MTGEIGDDKTQGKQDRYGAQGKGKAAEGLTVIEKV